MDRIAFSFAVDQITWRINRLDELQVVRLQALQNSILLEQQRRKDAVRACFICITNLLYAWVVSSLRILVLISFCSCALIWFAGCPDLSESNDILCFASQNVRAQLQESTHICDYYLQAVNYCSFCSFVEFLGCKTHKNLFALCTCTS